MAQVGSRGGGHKRMIRWLGRETVVVGVVVSWRMMFGNEREQSTTGCQASCLSLAGWGWGTSQSNPTLVQKFLQRR